MISDMIIIAKPIGIVVRICINKNQIFFFFSTTMIFHKTLHNPAKKHRMPPAKKRGLVNFALIKRIPIQKNITGKPSNTAIDKVKSSGMTFLFT